MAWGRSTDFKPIPEGTKRLTFKLWGCGDDCGCNAFQIHAVLDGQHPLVPHYHRGKGDWSYELWESSWFNPCDGMTSEEIDELREEVNAANGHYLLKIVTEGSWYDWEVKYPPEAV